MRPVLSISTSIRACLACNILWYPVPEIMCIMIMHHMGGITGITPPTYNHNTDVQKLWY